MSMHAYVEPTPNQSRSHNASTERIIWQVFVREFCTGGLLPTCKPRCRIGFIKAFERYDDAVDYTMEFFDSNFFERVDIDFDPDQVYQESFMLVPYGTLGPRQVSGVLKVTLREGEHPKEVEVLIVPVRLIASKADGKGTLMLAGGQKLTVEKFKDAWKKRRVGRG